MGRESGADFQHTPVLLAECLAALDVRPDGLYVDGTAGGGGHAAAIASRLRGGHLYALDQDPAAIAAATKALAGLPATVIQASYQDAPQVLTQQEVHHITGALLDLGVSSHQLDASERGFSYHNDAPLDMRMSQSGPTAADLIATAGRQQLADILRNYGEEKHAWAIAGRIVSRREEQPITTTGQLAELIASALPAAARRGKHPARRSFQALRIAVNGELDALSEGLDSLFKLLEVGGRLAVITFHSLEDRLVKQRFAALCTACTCPPDFPVCVCGGVALAKRVGKNPTVPGEAEQQQNRRSRSAKLRAVEKLAYNRSKTET